MQSIIRYSSLPSVTLINFDEAELVLGDQLGANWGQRAARLLSTAVPALQSSKGSRWWGGQALLPHWSPGPGSGCIRSWEGTGLARKHQLPPCNSPLHKTVWNNILKSPNTDSWKCSVKVWIFQGKKRKNVCKWSLLLMDCKFIVLLRCFFFFFTQHLSRILWEKQGNYRWLIFVRNQIVSTSDSEWLSIMLPGK